MRALLVSLDGVHEVEHDGSLQSFYKLIGCNCICSAGAPARGHTTWVDDEGLMTMQEGSQVNRVSWHREPIAGRILVTGLDEQGETTPATMSVEELSYRVVIGRLFF